MGETEVLPPNGHYPHHSNHLSMPHPQPLPLHQTALPTSTVNGQWPTTYGSVTTSIASQRSRKLVSGKRYRIPFFILLSFNWGLVIFFSIVVSSVSVCVDCVFSKCVCMCVISSLSVFVQVCVNCVFSKCHLQYVGIHMHVSSGVWLFFHLLFSEYQV